MDLKHKVFGRMMVEDVSAKDNKLLEQSVMPTFRELLDLHCHLWKRQSFFPRVTSALSVREGG